MRRAAVALILCPALGLAQHVAKPPDKNKVLDAMAKTPVFTQAGADAVKRVVAGGQARKAEEKVLEPAPQMPTAAPGQGPNPANPTAPQGQPNPAPSPDPVFGWRLAGISYGKKQGVAVFEADGHSVSVVNGASLDAETRIVSVDRRNVVLIFHGKKLRLMPW